MCCRLPNGGVTRVWENNERVFDDNLPVPLPPRNTKPEITKVEDVPSFNLNSRKLHFIKCNLILITVMPHNKCEILSKLRCVFILRKVNFFKRYENQYSDFPFV